MKTKHIIIVVIVILVIGIAGYFIYKNNADKGVKEDLINKILTKYPAIDSSKEVLMKYSIKDLTELLATGMVNGVH